MPAYPAGVAYPSQSPIRVSGYPGQSPIRVSRPSESVAYPSKSPIRVSRYPSKSPIRVSRLSESVAYPSQSPIRVEPASLSRRPGCGRRQPPPPARSGRGRGPPAETAETGTQARTGTQIQAQAQAQARTGLDATDSDRRLTRIGDRLGQHARAAHARLDLRPGCPATAVAESGPESGPTPKYAKAGAVGLRALHLQRPKSVAIRVSGYPECQGRGRGPSGVAKSGPALAHLSWSRASPL